MSDATAIFTITGPTATIDRGQLANRWAGLEAQPGSTVDLQTGFIDGYIVVTPLKEIQNILKNIPIVNLLVNLKDKLTRLHVKGHWSETSGKLISKEPIEDVKEATVDFLRGVVETGGQFTQKMRDSSTAIFKSIQKREGAEK
jgi:hypothetical protein